MSQLPIKIPFNKPFLTGKETVYIEQAVREGHLSGDGRFTRQCQQFFEQRYGFSKTLMTTSCTDALEMCALLLDTQMGDEIIMPAYTFVSSANAFVLRGATVVFADSGTQNPNITAETIAPLITPRTKAIVLVHYAGVACDMDSIMLLAEQHKLWVVEDAAHAIDSFYKKRPLGSIGHLATFSFHETKNVIAGEGGLLVINEPALQARAEILREKGTNRSAFFRGEVNKYEWVDIGSSFLPSELIAAFLFAQLEQIDVIQQKRIALWNCYCQHLQDLAQKGFFQMPQMPDFATRNGHIFYIICPENAHREQLIRHLRLSGIYAVFHYLPLHLSPYYKKINEQQPNSRPVKQNQALPNAEYYAEGLLRLPLYYELTIREVEWICAEIEKFYVSKNVPLRRYDTAEY